MAKRKSPQFGGSLDPDVREQFKQFCQAHDYKQKTALELGIWIAIHMDATQYDACVQRLKKRQRIAIQVNDLAS